MLSLPSTNTYLNQCDMAEKPLDLGLEDLSKVRPGTRHCEMGIMPASCMALLPKDEVACEGLPSSLSGPLPPPYC